MKVDFFSQSSPNQLFLNRTNKLQTIRRFQSGKLDISGETLLSVCGQAADPRDPSCELVLHAWPVTDKDEPIIPPRRAVSVPRSIAYLNVEDVSLNLL